MSGTKRRTMQDLFGDSEESEEEEEEKKEDEVMEEVEEKKEERRTMEDLFGDDDDDEEEEAKVEEVVPAKPTMNDLFGEDEDDDEGEEEVPAKEGNKKLMNELFGGDEEEMAFDGIREQEDHERVQDEFDCGRTKMPQSSQSVTMVKLPRFLRVENEAYENGASRVDSAVSTIRWRYVKDEVTDEYERDEKTNKPLLESNAKIIKLSDGRLQLLVGDDRYNLSERRQVTKTHLYAHTKPKKGRMILNQVTKIHKHMNLAPHNMSSETHKKVTLKARERSIQKSKVKQIYTTDDPVKNQQARARLREDQIKREARRRHRDANPIKRPGVVPSMTASFLEDEDNQTSLRAIKRAARSANGTSRPLLDHDEDDDQHEMDDFIVGDEDDDESDDIEPEPMPSKRSSTSSRRSAQRAAQAMKHDDDDDDDDEENDDEEEEEVIRPSSRRAPPSRRVIQDDDSEDDDDVDDDD